MTQPSPSLRGYLPLLTGFYLIPSNVIEHHCDTEGGEGIIDREVDHGCVVEGAHPSLIRHVGLRGDASQNKGYRIQKDQEQYEYGNHFLMCLEVFSLFSHFSLF